MDGRAYNKIQDGIIYMFQYGLITERMHFKYLDKLELKAKEDDINGIR